MVVFDFSKSPIALSLIVLSSQKNTNKGNKHGICGFTLGLLYAGGFKASAPGIALRTGCQRPDIVRISMMGTRTQALVTAACLAELGNQVVCVDPDVFRIQQLNQGTIDADEPGLAGMVRRNLAFKRLSFSDDAGIAIPGSAAVFLSVDAEVEASARSIGRSLAGTCVVVDQSGVSLGSGRRIYAWIAGELARRAEEHEVHMVSMPELLRAGSSIEDFMHPPRIIVGLDSSRASLVMHGLYDQLKNEKTPFIETGLDSAEAIRMILTNQTTLA